MDCIPLILLLFCTNAGRGVSVSPHVVTEPSVTLREGSEAMLPCRYDRVVFAVYWYKNVTTSSAFSQKLLVYLDLYYNEGERNGPRLDDGYNITDNFALVIHEVRQEDEGTFICEISDFEEGAVYRNSTILNVQGNEQNESSDGISAGVICAILLCVIVAVILIGLGLLILADKKNILPPRVSVMVRHCTRRKDERNQEDEEQRLNNERLSYRESLRDKIKLYTPGEAADHMIPEDAKTKRPNIALFGLMGAGKSTFINALVYSFTGAYKEHCEMSDPAYSGGKTLQRYKLELKSLPFNFVDNRGMSDFSITSIKQFLEEIRGQRGTDPKNKIKRRENEKAHCAVFVLNGCNPGPTEDWSHYIEQFFKQTCKYFGRNPLLIITHKDQIDENKKEAYSKLPDHSVFENYTKENHEEDIEKDIELLEFIWKALEMCDYNMAHIARKEKEETETSEVKEDKQPSKCIIL